MNRITIGANTFTDADILSGNIVQTHSVVGEELPADSLTFEIHSTHTGNHRLYTKFLEWYHTVNNEGYVIADTDIQTISYATPVYYYIDDILQGKFFVSKVSRIGQEEFKIECFSVVGLLITNTHFGGVYTGETASIVIADILNGIDYTLDAGLSDARVRGYLPVASKRDNLQQVLFAIGGAIKINAQGTIQIVQMSDLVVNTITAERVYIGGTVERNKAYDGVELTEHNYFISQEVETLFDDSVVGDQLITFKEPHHSYTITGGTITSSGANYVRVSPTGGASSITLTGKKYIHVQRVVTAGNVSVTGSENIMSVTDAYLANPEIADTLCERVWKYAQANTYIKQDIVVGMEKAGDMVKVINPYTYESVSAMMTALNITMSKTNKGAAEFLLGYTPEGVVSGFRFAKLITENGSWSKEGDYVTVNGEVLTDDEDQPVEVDKIRIICVGGGQGGGASKAGGNGQSVQADFERYQTSSSRGSGYRVRNVSISPATGGEGGKGGNGGFGGNIFEMSLDIADGDGGSISIGGATNGSTNPDVNPDLGGDTSFTLGNRVYTSANGRKYNDGYVEVKTGAVFGNKGANGLQGGKGGDGRGQNSQSGEDGGNVGQNIGGKGSTPSQTSTSTTLYIYYGAGGGGAANGKNGTNAASAVGGNGGNGSNGADATNYGAGGGGANGGGGAGGGSTIWYEYDNTSRWDQNIYTRSNGVAGTGANGGNGKQGCLIIYY